MRPTSFPFRLLLLTIMLNGAVVLASAAAPVAQAWAVRIDGPTNSPIQAAGMDVGASGDVFLAGYFRSGDYYLHDIVIIRRSPSGAPVWERRYEPPEGPSANETASAIVAHGTNVYVAGSITGTNTWDPDFLMLKYRDTGELEWAVRSDGPGDYNELPSAIAVDSQGNVLVLGESYRTTGGLDIVVLKYGPAGNL